MFDDYWCSWGLEWGSLGGNNVGIVYLMGIGWIGGSLEVLVGE